MPAKPQAFVIMTFGGEFDVVYTELIHGPLTQIGFDVTRADTNLNQQNIMKDVTRGIADADLVIADLTDRNPNVYYELGIAHGLNRKTVLLTQSIEQVPFDLQAYRVVEYSVIFNKAPELANTLKSIGKAYLSGAAQFGNPVSDFLGITEGQPVSSAATPPKPPRTPVRPRKKRTEHIIGERGFLDWIVDIDKYSKQSTSSLQRITAATQDLAERLTRRTQLLKEIGQQPGPGQAVRIQSIASDAAADLAIFANAIEQQIPRFARPWKKFADSSDELLTSPHLRSSADREQVSALRQPTHHMLENLSTARSNLLTLRDTLAALSGITFDLTRAAKTAVSALDQLDKEWEKSEAGAARILALIDDLAPAKETT